MSVIGKTIPPSSLGGGKQGISPKQNVLNYKSGEQTAMRAILRRGWNTAYATGTVNGRNMATTPYRAVNNLGDFLSRQNYSCGGPNTIKRNKPGYHVGSVPNNCDGTGIPPSSCNVKFVSDSSDYITYKKQRAMNVTYNDSKFGGDQSNASFVDRMAIRR